MTWVKLSDDFADECQILSNGAYRTHVDGLCYVMRKETGGAIPKVRIRRVAESPSFEIDIQELLDAGFWTNEGDHYVIRHHMEWQVEPDVLAHRRALAAARQRKQRYSKAGLTPPNADEG